jgi:hypothetical protein
MGTMLLTSVSKESDATSSALTITASTNQPSYLLRQEVQVNGTMILNGQPASNMVVVVQINDPTDQGLAYRTLQIQNPSLSLPVNITNLFLTDTHLNSINTAKIDTDVYVGMTFISMASNSYAYFATLTVFDANFVPIATRGTSGSLPPNQPVSSSFPLHIPKWACSGKSFLVCNVYTNEPKMGGVALSLEKTGYFAISRVQQGQLEYPTLPQPPPQTTPGIYNTQVWLPPDPTVGSYVVYVIGQASPIIVSSAFTYFNVLSSSGYPPQASFAYWPAAPYENMTVNFDASSSTPEGFNDTITKYEWNFGDGTPKVIKQGNPPNPTTTHQYVNAGQYAITLNVTDNEGLWCTTSKPITTYPEFGPKANFTYEPQGNILVNQTITFDATGCTSGWSKQLGDYSPIINYNWNWGDDAIIDTANPITTHNYTQPANYTVTLIITDSAGRTDTASTIIQIYNATAHPWDVNGDKKVDIKDILIVAKAYGTNPGDSNYDPRADVNGDTKIDIKDILLVAKHYGEQYP